MPTAEELEKMFNISSDRIEEIDEKASKGSLEGERGPTVVGPGRPPKYGQAMQQVTFKETEENIKRIDARASQLGIKRSDYLRALIENDLSCSGIA